jgi:A/G-specific adenine glycosylase
MEASICSPAINDKIEELYRESLALKERIALEGDKERRNILELELIYRLIAEYSQLGANMAIEGETPENLARSRHLEYLEKHDAGEIALEAKKVKWFRRKIKAWFPENRREFPWRETEDPYRILIAEIFLQRTRAENVVPVYRSFLERYPSLETLATATLEEIQNAIAPLGLEFRASQLQRLARQLPDGRIPRTEAKLRAMPGVGRYTANAVLAAAFHKRAPVLDTNVVRILERFFGLRGRGEKSRDDSLWQAAEAIAPQTNVREWNWALIDFGALVCTAVKPRCPVCPLQKKCDYCRLPVA